jgi:hypothetical protein
MTEDYPEESLTVGVHLREMSHKTLVESEDFHEITQDFEREGLGLFVDPASVGEELHLNFLVDEPERALNWLRDAFDSTDFQEQITEFRRIDEDEYHLDPSQEHLVELARSMISSEQVAAEVVGFAPNEITVDLGCLVYAELPRSLMRDPPSDLADLMGQVIEVYIASIQKNGKVEVTQDPSQMKPPD